jgi:hypothetical protein
MELPIDAAAEVEPPKPLHRRVEVAMPQPMDVLCGRGKSVTRPGHAQFHAVVNSHKEAYQQAKRREEKTQITLQVANELQSGPNPVRFLIKEKDKWYTVDNEYVKDKISHALRSRQTDARKRRAEQQKQQSLHKKQVAPEIDASVRAIIQEQQLLLKKMIDEHIFYEQGDSNANTGSTITDTTTGKIDIQHPKLCRCPMEKGLHICHHLGG